MKGTGGLIIVVLGLLILWLAVTGKAADILTKAKALGMPQPGDPGYKPTGTVGGTTPSVPSTTSAFGFSALPGLPQLPTLPLPYALN